MISSIKAFSESVINIVSSIDDLSINSITSIKKITVIVHLAVIQISNLCQSMHKSHAKCVVSTCPLILQGAKDFPLSFLLNNELVKHRHSLDLAILPRRIICFLYSGVDPEILKMGGALCWPPWLADEENFRLQMV